MESRILRADESISTQSLSANRISTSSIPSTSGILTPTNSSSSLISLLSPASHVANTTYPSASVDGVASVASTVADGEPFTLYAGQHQHAAYQDFLCGLGAAMFETLITYPLNKLIFRQQLHGITLRQSIGQLKQEGVRFLYRGLLFPLMQKGASRSVMFGMYDEYRRLLGCRHTHRADISTTRHTFTWCHGLAAFLAGTTEAIAMTPFERVQVLMQNAKYHATLSNSFDALRRGIRPYGIREYYRGLSMILVRNGSTNVLFFSLRNPLKEMIVGAGRKEMSDNRLLVADFGSGAVLGACLSTTFYPINVIKSRMQSRLGGEFQKPSAVLLKILKERGFSVRELYRGVTLNFSRSLLTWGLTNAGYEFIQRHAFGKTHTGVGSISH